MRAIDEFTLLCERCGYVLEGLAREGNCPECGLEIAAAIGEARRGSPWQRQPNLRGWASTHLEALRRPVRLMKSIMIETEVSRWFGAWTILAASALPAITTWLGGIVHVATDDSPRRTELDKVVWFVMAFVGIIVTWVAFSALLELLTWIEMTGIRAFSRVNSRRITRTVATAICSHACVGWSVGALAVVGTRLMMPAVSEARLGSNRVQITVLVACVAAFMVGLLTFEILVYIGVRTCRFANRRRNAEGEAPRHKTPTMDHDAQTPHTPHLRR